VENDSARFKTIAVLFLAQQWMMTAARKERVSATSVAIAFHAMSPSVNYDSTTSSPQFKICNWQAYATLCEFSIVLLFDLGEELWV
jgi:hypothetical protein